MSTSSHPPPAPDDGLSSGPAAEQQALQDALARLLAPVARLAVARGMPFAVVEEMLKRAFVHAAADAHPGLLPHRKVSRISTATGINRREVTRLTQQATPESAPKRSLVSELFAHWLSSPAFHDAQGQPLPLPRLGPAPSFEALAQAITRDVHSRSLLDEMLRLGLAHLDDESGFVVAETLAVPRGDAARLLSLLGHNVGDHLAAAVENVGEGNGRHFEVAFFAEGLSDDTLTWLKELTRAEWKRLRGAVVPELEKRLEVDAASGLPGRRWRLGMYSFDEARLAEETPGAKQAAQPSAESRRESRTGK